MIHITPTRINLKGFVLSEKKKISKGYTLYDYTYIIISKLKIALMERK